MFYEASIYEMPPNLVQLPEALFEYITHLISIDAIIKVKDVFPKSEENMLGPFGAFIISVPL